MKVIRKEYHIMVPLSRVWAALVEPKEIERWGAGPAKMDDKVGTKFSLWGGDIHGKNIEVEPEKKLVQEWMAGKWDKYSRVTFRLTHKDGCSRLLLEHGDVPDKEGNSINEGWDTEYLGPMKKYLEEK